MGEDEKRQKDREKRKLKEEVKFPPPILRGGAIKVPPPKGKNPFVKRKK